MKVWEGDGIVRLVQSNRTLNNFPQGPREECGIIVIHLPHCLRILCFHACTMFAENKQFSICVCVFVYISDIIRILKMYSNNFVWYWPYSSLYFHFIVFCKLFYNWVRMEVSLTVLTLLHETKGSIGGVNHCIFRKVFGPWWNKQQLLLLIYRT